MHVPIIHEQYDIMNTHIYDIVNYADGMSKLNPKVAREGLVFKQVDGNVHCKAVSNKYLLKAD